MVGAGWCLYGCDEFGVGLPILSLFQIPTHELWMSIETLRVVVGRFRAKVLLGLWKLSWRMHYTSKMLLVFHFSDFEKHCLCVGFNLGLFFSEKHTFFFWFLICQAGGTMSARCWVALGIWPSDPMQGRLERGRVLEFSTLWGEDSDPLKFYGRICSFRPGDFAERNSTNVRWFLRCWMYVFFSDLCQMGWGTYIALQHSSCACKHDLAMIGCFSHDGEIPAAAAMVLHLLIWWIPHWLHVVLQPSRLICQILSISCSIYLLCKHGCSL